MPSGTLPNAGSLGDPQITTGDYQTQINQLLAYVRSLQSELAALSGTTIREGAVRGVGDGASLLADKAVLDERLGTSGNLGTMAQESSLDYVTKDDIDPASPNQVWAGSKLIVDYTELSEFTTGFYLIEIDFGFSEEIRSLMFISSDRPGLKMTYTAWRNVTTSNIQTYDIIYESRSFSAKYRDSNISSGSSSSIDVAIKSIYKV